MLCCCVSFVGVAVGSFGGVAVSSFVCVAVGSFGSFAVGSCGGVAVGSFVCVGVRSCGGVAVHLDTYFFNSLCLLLCVHGVCCHVFFQ